MKNTDIWKFKPMNITATPMGDRHKSGQTRRIHTDTISYFEKPRDYQIEAAFSKLIDAMAQWGVGQLCQVPALLENRGSCHTQAVVCHSSTDEAGLGRYFYRAGGVIFLCYLLGSTDLHCENIIACGDMPVLVDVETLLSGKLRPQSGDTHVLRSHLVCSFAQKEGETVDVGGFGGIKGENLPFCGEKTGTIYAYASETVQGFTDAYRAALAHKEALFALLEGFSTCRFRQILRPTAVYAGVIRYLQGLQEETRFPAAKALLERAYWGDIDPDRLEKCRKTADEEIRAVLAGEIPLFCVQGDDTALLDGNALVQANFLEQTPVAAAKLRLDSLCEEDLTRQAAILKAAIRAADPAPRPIPPVSVGNFAPGEQIGAWIAEQVLPGSGWFELTTEGAFTPMGLGLYSGLSGLGCMYAALYRKTGNRQYLQAVEQIVHQVISALGQGPVVATNETASLGSGIGGIALALQHIAELTGEKVYAQWAAQLLSRLIPGQADGDYLNGVGALPVAFDRCGVKMTADMTQWLTKILRKPVTLTGFAHGAAGRALALSRLQGNQDRIRQLIQWENGCFLPQEGNWQDIRDPKKPGFMSGWCSGAPGIGMARQAIDAEHSDVAAAKAFLEKQTPSRRHSLCCGTAARLMAASRLGVRVDGLFSELCEAEKKGQLRLLRPVNTPEMPISLMQGVAGVAYALAMYGDPMSGGMLL